MSKYIGHRSTDAEIFLKLDEGRIDIDYSLTKYQTPINNNHVVYHKDNIPFHKVLFLEFYYFIRLIAGLFGCVLMTNFMRWETLLYPFKNHLKTQELYQKLAKMSNDYNQYEDITFGKLETTHLKVIIPHNLYIKYFLDGDYQNKIKTISLERNLVKCIRYGKQQTQKQCGWKMCFEFKTPPQYGSCIVRYL